MRVWARAIGRTTPSVSSETITNTSHAASSPAPRERRQKEARREHLADGEYACSDDPQPPPAHLAPSLALGSWPASTASELEQRLGLPPSQLTSARAKSVASNGRRSSSCSPA